MYEKIKIVSILALLFLLMNCSSSTTRLTMQPKPYNPTYKIAEQKESKQYLGIKVALLKLSSYLEKGNNLKIDNRMSENMEAFSTQAAFVNSLEASIESIIVSKGYNLIDIVDDYKDLSEEEINNIDFFIIPKINLYALEDINILSKVPLDINFKKDIRGDVKCKGNVRLEGEMSFTILNPKTNDIVYSKHKKIKETAPISVSVERYTADVFAEELYKDLINRCIYGTNNARSKTLEEIYYSYIKAFNKNFPEGKSAKKLYENTKIF